MCLIHPDGTAAHQILTDLPDVGNPDWSPDGTRLAFNAATTDGAAQIMVSGLDGADPTVVATCDDNCLGFGPPAWSPDGTGIAYTWAAEDAVRVSVVDPVTGRSTEFARLGIDEVRWAPSGDQLVGTVSSWDPKDDTAQTGGALVVIESGVPARTILPADALASHPDWHPNSHLIVFATYGLSEFQTLDAAASNLYTVNADGTGLTQLTHFKPGGPRATQPTWTPDGTAIMFTLVSGEYDEIRHIATIRPDGSQLTDLGINGTHNRLQPGRPF